MHRPNTATSSQQDQLYPGYYKLHEAQTRFKSGLKILVVVTKTSSGQTGLCSQLTAHMSTEIIAKCLLAACSGKLLSQLGFLL